MTDIIGRAIEKKQKEARAQYCSEAVNRPALQENKAKGRARIISCRVRNALRLPPLTLLLPRNNRRQTLIHFCSQETTELQREATERKLPAGCRRSSKAE
jgi:hypothetical protein